MKNKPVSATLFPWLTANLGKCLGGLTGQDFPALKTAVQAVELWCSADSSGRQFAAVAFGSAVRAMQPNLRYLAFHSIAHVGDWSHRLQLWTAAGLELPSYIPRCKYE
jgi:hypothetical protein